VIAVDTNVLVTAHREDLPKHRLALEKLAALAAGDTPWAIPVFCFDEFVRVVTQPRLFDPPSTLDEAIAALEGLLESPTLRILSPGGRYPKLFAEALREADARGNLAFDAQIAAVCREQGAGRLLTMDRDFARFRDLQLLDL
jgi:toxin-antitoxin system PIN domain toxin